MRVSSCKGSPYFVVTFATFDKQNTCVIQVVLDKWFPLMTPVGAASQRMVFGLSLMVGSLASCYEAAARRLGAASFAPEYSPRAAQDQRWTDSRVQDSGVDEGRSEGWRTHVVYV